MVRLGLAVLLASLVGTTVAGMASAEQPFARGHQLGLSGGSPAGLNLEYAYEFGTREISVCGGYYGFELWGIQGGFTLVRGDDARKYVAVNLVGGHFYVLDSESDESWEWGYGGFEAAFHYRAFFIAPAVVLANGTRNGTENDGMGILGRLGFRWGL